MTEQISTTGPLGDLGLVGKFGEMDEETSISIVKLILCVWICA